MLYPPDPQKFGMYYHFFFNDTATTEIYTLSLHDALPISPASIPCWPTTGNPPSRRRMRSRSEEHTSELQSQSNLVCRLLLEKKKHIFHPYYVEQAKGKLKHIAALVLLT